jgi:hypothetical protein
MFTTRLWFAGALGALLMLPTALPAEDNQMDIA